MTLCGQRVPLAKGLVHRSGEGVFEALVEEGLLVAQVAQLDFVGDGLKLLEQNFRVAM